MIHQTTQIMKKYFFMLVMLFTAAVICSCSNDDEDDPTPAKFELKMPCTKWHSSIDEVRDYMNSIGKFTEQEPVPYFNGDISYLFVNVQNVSYNYVISKNGLVQSDWGFFGMNENFDEFFSTITTKYGITNWEEIHYANDSISWAAMGSNKDTSIHIGKNDTRNVMFAAFECIK